MKKWPVVPAPLHHKKAYEPVFPLLKPQRKNHDLLSAIRCKVKKKCAEFPAKPDDRLFGIEKQFFLEHGDLDLPCDKRERSKFKE